MLEYWLQDIILPARFIKSMQKEAHQNPYSKILTEIEIDGKKYRYYDIKKLND